MKSLIMHHSIIVRFLSMYALALVLFLAAWTLSYYLLPEGVLRGRTGAQLLAGSEAADSFLAEWLRISLINLAVGCLFVVAPNIIRSNGFPLGYLTPLTWAILYAVYLGTNSFTFPLPDGKLSPSLAVLGRSGPYEIAAFILAGVATYSLPRYQLKGRFLRERISTIPPSDRRAFTKTDLIGLGVAILMLLAANTWEAYQIVSKF